VFSFAHPVQTDWPFFENTFGVDNLKHSSASTDFHATLFRQIEFPFVCPRFLFSFADILTCSAADG